MILVLSILADHSTNLRDIVELLHRRNGHAFVSESARPYLPDFPKRRRDEVELTNFARAKWQLRIDPKRGYAQGQTLPWRRLFDSKAAYTQQPRLRRFRPESWTRPGGQIATVDEILASTGIAAERCHWRIGRRLVAARFSAEKIEEALPDLARAAGGIYDAKTRQIEFDPTTFRDQALASPAEEETSRVERRRHQAALLKLAVKSASDDTLRAAFESPKSLAVTSLREGDQEAVQIVRSYVAAALKTISASGPENGVAKLREIVDLNTLPKIEFSPRGNALVEFRSRDGKTGVGF